MREMTEGERRRLANMRTVLKTGRWQNATELAKALGITKGSLSQLIGSNPQRSISERTAREWERRLGLAEGALDTPPVYPSPPPDVPRIATPPVAPARLTPGNEMLATQLLDDVMRAVDSSGVRLPPDKYRAAVSALYRMSVRAGGTVDSGDVSAILTLAK